MLDLKFFAVERRGDESDVDFETAFELSKKYANMDRLHFEDGVQVFILYNGEYPERANIIQKLRADVCFADLSYELEAQWEEEDAVEFDKEVINTIQE